MLYMKVSMYFSLYKAMYNDNIYFSLYNDNKHFLIYENAFLTIQDDV